MLCASTWHHAPTHCCKASPRRTISPAKLKGRSFPMSRSVRVAIVGDVHDDWDLEADRKALQMLKPDLVLFTGDFGNENVDLVRSVANLDMAKAVILGNHDAWSTRKFSSSAKEKDGVQLQLESLGDEHVGYRRLDFPMLKLSVVGGRPFSCGGSRLFRKNLLKARYGISGTDDSTKRICKAASGTPDGHFIILLAHNGPTGLGSNMNDICGRDFVYGGGDHGDQDLAAAIAELKETTNISIPLVVFGHMHQNLAYGGHRKMTVVGNDGTTYLNGAIVPRVKSLASNEEGTQVDPPEIDGTLRAFTVAEISDGRIEKIAETWVSVRGEIVTTEQEQILYTRTS